MLKFSIELTKQVFLLMSTKKKTCGLKFQLWTLGSCNPLSRQGGNNLKETRKALEVKRAKKGEFHTLQVTTESQLEATTSCEIRKFIRDLKRAQILVLLDLIPNTTQDFFFLRSLTEIYSIHYNTQPPYTNNWGHFRESLKLKQQFFKKWSCRLIKWTGSTFQDS